MRSTTSYYVVLRSTSTSSATSVTAGTAGYGVGGGPYHGGGVESRKPGTYMCHVFFLFRLPKPQKLTVSSVQYLIKSTEVPTPLAMI